MKITILIERKNENREKEREQNALKKLKNTTIKTYTKSIFNKEEKRKKDECVFYFIFSTTKITYKKN